MDWKLLQRLCEIPSPSGSEVIMKDFIVEFVKENQKDWKVQPEIIQGEEWQDCLMLKFGNPKVAAFAHLDTTGFMVRYDNQLIPIGSPDAQHDDRLIGQDSLGLIDCRVKFDSEGHLFYTFESFGRGIDTGTTLTYAPDFKKNGKFVQSPYLDNRAGIWNLLKLAETLENGLLVFSCWEEVYGGSVPFLVKYAYETHGISKMLVSDITWATDGVHHGKGAVISIRDRNIPRRGFINKLIEIAKAYNINYQLEVEGDGSSDGREIHQSPYPIDWCFVGAPQSDPHSNHESIHIHDLKEMNLFYGILFQELNN